MTSFEIAHVRLRYFNYIEVRKSLQSLQIVLKSTMTYVLTCTSAGISDWLFVIDHFELSKYVVTCIQRSIAIYKFAICDFTKELFVNLLRKKNSPLAKCRFVPDVKRTVYCSSNWRQF